MNIAVIGGGFTGLSAAYRLTTFGHRVTVYEKEPALGGLAGGFRTPQWEWHLEAAYHHLFTNDNAAIGLMRDLGLSDKLIVTRPITSTLWHNRMYQLDSPTALLRFPGLSAPDKIRTAGTLAFLKLFPFWKLLEGITAEQLLTSINGINAFRTLWEPLLYGKFGTLAPTVSASWFWARIVKRTPNLCYIDGGFHTLVTALERAITDGGGTVHTGTLVKHIGSVSRKDASGRRVPGYTIANTPYDSVLMTLPTPIAQKILPGLPDTYTRDLRTIPHLFAQTLILETDTPMLKNVYWLNVTDRSFPFIAAVDHTNFMDARHYGGRHISYFGNYLPEGHPYLSLTKERLLKLFMPYVRRLNPAINAARITDSYLFTAPYAQPVHQLHYSEKIPSIRTPLPGIYMANMDYVCPWDRGTNYAVELGARAADIMTS